MSTRCFGLDSKGKRCKNKSDGRYSYHGDNEIYGWQSIWPSWVLVPLCKEHHPKDAKTHAKDMRK